MIFEKQQEVPAAIIIIYHYLTTIKLQYYKIMESIMEQKSSKSIAVALEKNIKFQANWRRRICIAHTITSIGMIFFSAAAAFAGNIDGPTGAFFAAIAMICASLEKGLKLSEKWKLHLKTQIKLENIKLKYDEMQFTEEADIIKEIADVMNSYAVELQVEESPDSLNLKNRIDEVRA